MILRSPLRSALALLCLGALPATVLAGDVLSTDGYVLCQKDGDIQINDVDIQYDRTSQQVKFDVSGSSSTKEKVIAHLTFTAYGKQVYSKTFNPCAHDTRVDGLCPVPAASFHAHGTQKVPDQFASMIPGIAFSIPDLDGQAKLTLTAAKGGKQLACIDSHIGNGKTANIPAVKYAAAGIAGAALVLSSMSSLSSFANAGGSTSSPSFIETLGWFQSMSMNGMLSVQYPAVYSSFSQNFAFSTGLVPWDNMQKAIDNFRQSTGGNLTHDNVEYLRRTSQVQGSAGDSSLSRRSFAKLDKAWLFGRDVHVDEGNSGSSDGGNSGGNNQSFVSGIAGYAQKLTVPRSNIFMTVLLVFAIVIAAITAGILLFKVILEAWALIGKFPKSLVSFRKRYWWLLAKTITNLILALYSVWTLYCIYQFTNGDSWAAKVLAAVTLAIFTAVLAGFTICIWLKARKSKKAEGDVSELYENKDTWRKYSLFYDIYKRSYWWLFVPVIIYMFAKGCVIAAGEGNGLVQCGGQLIVDAILLILLLWSRPYNFKSGNWINIIIQVVRVISVVCILVFVEELHVDQTTKTVIGYVLIVVQAVLTAILGILIAVNAIIQCCRKNPHRIARKEAEKKAREHDELTPLDAHNSMLMYDMDKKSPVVDVESMHTRGRSQNGYDMVPDDYLDRGGSPYGFRDESNEPLARTGQHMGHRMPSRDDTLRSISPERQSLNREPTLPDLSYRGRGIAM